MQNFEFIEIDIDTNLNELQVDDYINIDIKIKNISNVIVENVLFRLVVDENTFKLQDDNFKHCINDYGVIGTIEINSIANISIPVKIKELPKDLVSKIYCDVNCSYIYNDSLEDLNYTSKLYSVFFMEPKVFKREDFIYYVDKESVFENDTINHTIILKNNSETNINSLVIKNISKSEFEFIPNSIKINGMYQLGESIIDSITIGDMDSSEEIKVEFKTKTINSIDDVNLRFCIKYSNRRQDFIQKSENIILKMKYPLIDATSFTKTPTNCHIYIDDIVEFKLEVTNIGNSEAVNVIIKDRLDKELEYVENSLYVDYTRQNNNILSEGIKIDRLKPNESKIITYRAKATNISRNKHTYATCKYSNSENKTPNTTKSNNSEIKISGVKISSGNIKKEFSSKHTQIGDIITVSIEVENVGNIDCESIKIYDDINSCLEFIEDSLRINGEYLKGKNIYSGVNIDRLKSQSKLVITYQVRVLDLPKPNPIIDKTTLTYNYLYDGSIKSNKVSSSKTKIYVYDPNLSIESENDKLCYNEEDIYFDFILENKGNVGLENIYMKPNLPKELSIDYNSLIINNSPCNKIKDNEFLLPNMNVSQMISVRFKAKCKYISEYDVEATIYFGYEFRDLENKGVNKNIKKIKNNIKIANPKMQCYRNISHEAIRQNERFTQSIVVKNLGNIDYENVKIDLNETNFMKEKSINCLLNGREIPKLEILEIGELKVEDSINIDIDYLVDDINKYDEIINESYISATYKVVGEEESNVDYSIDESKIKFSNPLIQVKGKCEENTLFVNERYTYVYSIYNDGNIDFENLEIKIIIPDNIQYIKESIKINNEPQDIESFYKSINIGKLRVKGFINLSFDFIVNSVDYENKQISSTIIGEYKSNNNIVVEKFSSLDMELVFENKDLEIISCASHEYLQKGDILKIQNILNNTGTVDFIDLKLTDNIEPNLYFIKDSVYIDGENTLDINPIDGIYIKSLEASKNILISYEYEYKPKKYNSKIVHISDVKYSYATNNSKPKQEVKSSDEICIEAGTSTFKQFTIENKYILDIEEPDMYDIASAFSNAQIDNIHEIDTVSNKSIDNYNSTGKRVVIKGTIMNRIEYLIKQKQSSLYLLERHHPFTISINIPKDYYSEDIDFKVKCEDVFCKINNKRSLYISTLVSIEGVV